jgi:hypothetical protein
MPYAFRLLSYLYLKKVQGLLSLLWLIAFSNAQAFNELPEGKWSYQVGVDSWSLNASVAKDPEPWNAQNTNLLLPNAATKWPYKATSAFTSVSGSQQVSKSTYLSLKARADQTVGLRLDEAMLQHNLSPSLGLRFGVVNYKTSWCRSYEPDSVWIREVETICVTKGLQDVTGGAPGLQIFTNQTWGDYLVQSQVGLYRPLALGYAPREFGNYFPSPNFKVTKNNKVGFNVNVLNLQTAIEGRLSYIHANQRAYLPESDILGDVLQVSEMWFWGLSAPLTPRLTARLTQLMQKQRIECWSHLNSGNWCNLKVAQKKSATTIELAYASSSLDLLSFGWSQTTFDTGRDFFLADGSFVTQDQPFYIETRQLGAAWRHDWGAGLFSVLQVIQAKQKNGFDDLNFASRGNAIGLRVGYQF